MSNKPKKVFDGVGRPKGIIDDVVVPLAKATTKKVSPKVEQQFARSMTKRRNMKQIEKDAKRYYGK